MASGPDATAIGSGLGMGVGAMFGGPMGAMVGSSLGGLAGSMLGGGADKDAIEALKKAQQAIQAIPEPTVRDMQLVLSPLVQQGILTPEAYSTILQQPSEFLNVNIDQTARNAEIAALSQMQDIASEGGQDAQYRAAMNDATNQTNEQMQGQTGAILQNAAERGVSNSNLTAAAQLAQAFAGNANMANSSVNAAAEAEKRALQAISDSATLGGQINAQDYSQAAQRAAAIDAINRYNAQNSQSQSNMNTEGRNMAQAQNLDLAQQVAQYNTQVKNQQAQYNAQLPQQVFQNALAKASAQAGVAQPMANLYQNAAQAKATTQGNLVGGLGQNLTNYYNTQNLSNALKGLSATGSGKNADGTPAYGSAQNPIPVKSSWNGQMAHGGVVPGAAPLPGDHPDNDTVPARLSPGEIVVPRSAAGNPIKLAEFIASLPQGDAPKIHPEDVRTVLSALTQMRGMWKGGHC
jgi:hypothetical protein